MSEQTFKQDKLILRALSAEYIGQLPKPLHVVLSISSGSILVLILFFLILERLCDTLQKPGFEMGFRSLKKALPLAV